MEDSRTQPKTRVLMMPRDTNPAGTIFLQPVFVGDLVSFYTELLEIGRTSITVRVAVTAARGWDRTQEAQVTEAEITYVNIDQDHRPQPLRLRSNRSEAHD
jgi:acyl-CoA hydrolase